MHILYTQTVGRHSQPFLFFILYCGDFNVILGAHERLSSVSPSHIACQEFQEVIDNCELMQIPTHSTNFTWATRWAHRGLVACCINRALAN